MQCLPGTIDSCQLRQFWRLAGGIAVWTMALGASAATITNLQQLTQVVRLHQQTVADLELTVTVCAASRPALGIIIVRDDTGIELLQIGDFKTTLEPGDRISIRRAAGFLRQREMGVEIGAQPLVNLDGLHSRTGGTGEIALVKGMVPLRLEWFNYWQGLDLEVRHSRSGERARRIDPTALWHATIDASGATNFAPGLVAECYEGVWEQLPDFNLLEPVKIGVTPSFDLGFRTRQDRVGIRYAGFLAIPEDATYLFQVWSDDGAILFLGNLEVSILKLGKTSPPTATHSPIPGSTIDRLDERFWTTLEGRVSFVVQLGHGARIELQVNRQTIYVGIADTDGLDLNTLPGARIRVKGIGRGTMIAKDILTFNKLFVASARELELVESPLGTGLPSLPINTVAGVRGLPVEEATRALPVLIRGTVTGGIKTTREHWMSFQDDTRGIFVRLNGISNAIPVPGELWELEGWSAPGDFAPIIVAERITRLGEGLLPTPVKPTWTELLNGSRDVQWAELTGLVSAVYSNIICLQLPEGRMEVGLEGRFESELKPYAKTVVRIRGVLYALWDETTGEVQVGKVMMRNAAVSVDVPAPSDPFKAVERTPRELRRFDAQASAFRPVKVFGQVVYLDATQLFLEAGNATLRVLPGGQPGIQAGDLVEVVGYPRIERGDLILCEALLRKAAQAALRPAKPLDETAWSWPKTKSSRVSVSGKLLGWHTEEGLPVLEMQSDNGLYLARIAATNSAPIPFAKGSRLRLEGLYTKTNHERSEGAENKSFEMLLNSLADISLLAKPPWWTLPRMLTLLTAVLLILMITMIWNSQLRRLVEQRTHQLEAEIRERDRLERQNALESERSRIARDLHDDLGSSLTEISVLASTGRMAQANPAAHTNLFQSIGDRARSLIAALDVIVWAVDPEDNSLQSLADYVTGYTSEFLAHTSITCRFKVPVSFPPVTLEGSVRHDLLLAIKEALNNLVRHAGATELDFRLAVAGRQLEIDIADNGRGIDETAQNNGHGLRNLSTRLEKMGGTCAIASARTGGTLVSIRLPLAYSEPGAAKVINA